jgi:hypothetical protein
MRLLLFHLQYVSYPINPPQNSNNCKIQGEFSARGGNNDIRVFVVDQQGFNNFKNQNQFEVYFSTPQQVNGNIVTSVPCDRIIYVVYDNTFSLITNKTVETRVDFEYRSQ